MLKIPIKQLPAFAETIVLDKVPYTFTFLWNERAQHWGITVDDSAGIRIVSGVKMCVNVPLFFGYNNENLPKGDIIPMYSTGENKYIEYSDLGNSLQLIYFEEGD
jgi:hypothetical protein